MRWFVTGDKHGDWRPIYRWIDRMNFNNEDISIIILGDAGICWRKDKTDMLSVINYHERYYKTHIYFIDGNHENFDVLKSLPIAEDGLAHLSEHIHYIPRGFVGFLDFGDHACKVVTCGGADSVDRFRRTKHLNWWEDEAITQENIDKIGTGATTYVLTHCCPYSIFQEFAPYLITLTGINQDKVDHTSEKMLDQLSQNMIFDKWFFGHYHIDMKLNDKYTCLLHSFIELE